MIHYSVLPIEAVMQGSEGLDNADYMEITMNGVPMQVQRVNARQASIVRLLSCNPQDYLNPQYAPGRMIEFTPMTI